MRSIRREMKRNAPDGAPVPVNVHSELARLSPGKEACTPCRKALGVLSSPKQKRLLQKEI